MKIKKNKDGGFSAAVKEYRWYIECSCGNTHMHVEDCSEFDAFEITAELCDDEHITCVMVYQGTNLMALYPTCPQLN
jgi:hypothetical protein